MTYRHRSLLFALSVTDQPAATQRDRPALTPQPTTSPYGAAESTVPDYVTAAAKGELKAFEQLYHTHASQVFSLCMRMLQDRQSAEEATQDVFVRVWQKLSSFRGEAAFSTWLHKVSVRVVLSRKQSAADHLARSSPSELIAESPAPCTDLAQAFDLEWAISQLPGGARQIFVLHDIEGLTHDEISNHLGITTGGSKAQLHRARLILRSLLSR